MTLLDQMDMVLISNYALDTSNGKLVAGEKGISKQVKCVFHYVFYPSLMIYLWISKSILKHNAIATKHLYQHLHYFILDELL